MRKSRGITLIVLVVTIVVLLILAGITINTVVGDKGLISRASDAKVQMEIANEKEIVARAESLTVIRTKDTEISYEIFEPALQEEAGGNNVEASDAGDIIDVCFPDTNRYYEVDKNGKITGPNEVVNDENAGDITKGGSCDGSEEKPYKITCIEDLVILSNITNGKGNCIDENGAIKDVESVNTFKNKHIILTRTLNFESKYSYSKPELKWSYDSENDVYKIDETSTKTLKELITNKEGVGLVPIGKYDGAIFQGNFDGQGYTIQNIYMNRNSHSGFFMYVSGSIIENLTLKGYMNAINKEVGVFSYRSAGSKFYNCNSFVNIGNETSRGCGTMIVAYGNVTLINCTNLGNGTASGLVGFDDIGGTTTIVNCYNAGEIKGKSKKNQTYSSSCGIVNWAYSSGTRNIINTCSLGNITDYGANFYFISGGASIDLTNCFYPASMKKNNKNIEVNEGSMSFDSSNVQEALNQLNEYVKEHKNDYEITLKEWKLETINGEEMPVLKD